MTERSELGYLLKDAGLEAADREAVMRLFERVQAERTEAVRQMTAMRHTLEDVRYMLHRGRQAEVARRVLRFLALPLEERGRVKDAVRVE